MLALIDADLITYSVGFASDRKTYHVMGCDFENKKEAKEFCDRTDIDHAEITFTVQEEPLEYTLHSVKKLIESILEATKADDYKLFLTGKGNFRDEVAVTKKYKGNRDALHKPRHYEEIKKYLINVWEAEVVEGMEADDAMGIAQWKDLSPILDTERKLADNYAEVYAGTIIASLDKDMNMIPGWHYNWRKKETYWVDEEDAIRCFYKQMLTGDPTDNIQGVPKVGDKTADKILTDCLTEKEMFDKTEEAYYCGYYKHGTHTSIGEFLSSIDNIINEHAKLLWIRRTKEGELPFSMSEPVVNVQ